MICVFVFCALMLVGVSSGVCVTLTFISVMRPLMLVVVSSGVYVTFSFISVMRPPPPPCGLCLDGVLCSY